MKMVVAGLVVAILALGAWVAFSESPSDRLQRQLNDCRELAERRGNDAAVQQVCMDIEKQFIAEALK